MYTTMPIYEVLRLDIGLCAWEASTILTESHSQCLPRLFSEQQAGSIINTETLYLHQQGLHPKPKLL